MRFAFVLFAVAWLLLCRPQQGTTLQHGDLRLMNGSITSKFAGRVEVYDSVTKQWGTICIEGFTQYSADTVCRQLGNAGARVFGLAEMMGFEIGTGNIGLTQVHCDGENHILRCSALGIHAIDTTTCNHTQDVGIECENTPAFQYEGGVRLANGQNSSDGLLEVFIFNTWYLLCSESLSTTDVTAVCFQLGYTNNVDIDYIRMQVNTSAWRTSIKCSNGSECFSRCYTRPPAEDEVENNCPSNTFVHITCGFDSRLAQSTPAGSYGECYIGPVFDGLVLRHGDLRLVNGNQTSGRLEIYNKIYDWWSTLCTIRFNLDSADAACRQLGYARALHYGEADQLGYGPGSGSIDKTSFRCTSYDNHILRCSTGYSSFTDHCTHGEDVAITCENKPALEYEGGVRLLDGPYRSEGRLEVFMFGEWVSPCTKEFNGDAASAVCRQLGYTGRVGYILISQFYVSNSTPWAIPTLSCDYLRSTYCFSRCFVRPANKAALKQMQYCPSFSYIYVRCDFNPYVSEYVWDGSRFSCDFDYNPYGPHAPSYTGGTATTTSNPSIIVTVIMGMVIPVYMVAVVNNQKDN